MHRIQRLVYCLFDRHMVGAEKHTDRCCKGHIDIRLRQQKHYDSQAADPHNEQYMVVLQSVRRFLRRRTLRGIYALLDRCRHHSY